MKKLIKRFLNPDGPITQMKLVDILDKFPKIKSFQQLLKVLSNLRTILFDALNHNEISLLDYDKQLSIINNVELEAYNGNIRKATSIASKYLLPVVLAPVAPIMAGAAPAVSASVNTFTTAFPTATKVIGAGLGSYFGADVIDRRFIKGEHSIYGLGDNILDLYINPFLLDAIDASIVAGGISALPKTASNAADMAKQGLNWANNKTQLLQNPYRKILLNIIKEPLLEYKHYGTHSLDTFKPLRINEPMFHVYPKELAVRPLLDNIIYDDVTDLNVLQLNDMGHWSVDNILNDLKNQKLINQKTYNKLYDKYANSNTPELSLKAILGLSDELGFNAIKYISRKENPGKIAYGLIPNKTTSRYMKAVQEGDIETALALRYLHAKNHPKFVNFEQETPHLSNNPKSILYNREFANVVTHGGAGDLTWTVQDPKHFTQFDSEANYYGSGLYFGTTIKPSVEDIGRDLYGGLNKRRFYLFGDKPYYRTNTADYDFMHMEGYPVNMPYSKEVVVGKPGLAKLADAITYFKEGDPEVLSGQYKAGDVIPLSMRDNMSRNDIRFGWAPWLIPAGLGLSLSNTNK